jgi:hypothetical protein
MLLHVHFEIQWTVILIFVKCYLRGVWSVYISSLFLLPRDSHSGFAQPKDELNFDPELVEQYIELLCEFSPEKVYPYIVSSEGYRLDNTLKVCHLWVKCVIIISYWLFYIMYSLVISYSTLNFALICLIYLQYN